MVRKYTSFRVHKLNPKWLAVPGWANALGFKLTDPVGTLRGYWELVLNLADREFVQNHLTRSAFLDGMVAYPGGIMQDTTIKVWLDNDFHDGKVEIGGKESNFNAIKASLLGFGGSGDVMVTASAARGVMDAVDSPDKQFVIAPGGHMGVFVSRKAIAENWAITADWLADRSA
jgi:polyhydroxyalkanoate synthase